MYEDDTPAAERRAQALSLDRDLLRELLGQEELRELIDPGALEEVERQLAGSPRNPDELHDLLLRRGDLRAGEFDEAFAQASPFKGRVAHGMLTGAYISAVLGTELPGAGGIYLTQTLTFKRPPFSSRTIRVTIDAAAVPGWNEIDAVELIGDPAP